MEGLLLVPLADLHAGGAVTHPLHLPAQLRGVVGGTGLVGALLTQRVPLEASAPTAPRS
jgi:hypothetical protein